MMYDNMKNEVNTNEKMEYIQMKGLTLTGLEEHIYVPPW